MTIEWISSVNLAFVLLWSLLSLLIGFGLVASRRLLNTLPPQQASSLYLSLLSLPLVLSVALCLIVYTPAAEFWLMAEHCHEQDCAAHAPLSRLTPLSLLLLWVSCLLLLNLLSRTAADIGRSRRLIRSLTVTSRPRRRFMELASDDIAAFTIGFLQPKIFISRGVLNACNDRELEVLLRHEQAHARRRDNARIFLAHLLLLPLPGRWRDRLISHYRLVIEKCCDLAAAECTTRVEVAASILKISRLSSAASHSALTSNFVETQVEQRIAALLAAPSKPLPALWIPAAGMIVLVALWLSIAPLHREVEVLLSGF